MSQKQGYLKLKALMAENGLNQKDMADKLNMAISTFNRKLNGTAPWYYHECAAVAIMFGKSITEIFPVESDILKKVISR